MSRSPRLFARHAERGDHAAQAEPVEHIEQRDAPEQLVAPPRPKGVASLRVLKQMYRDWIAAGGTPPIYS